MDTRYIYDDNNTEIGSIDDNRLIIHVYGFYYNHRDNFTLESIAYNAKLYYVFMITRYGLYATLESEYDVPSYDDHKSILELSHILRYKYDRVLDTVFKDELLSEKYCSYDCDFIHYGKSDRLPIMGIHVKVDESVWRPNTLLSKLFHKIFNHIGEPYIDKHGREIIANNMIHVFITSKPITSKEAINSQTEN